MKLDSDLLRFLNTLSRNNNREWFEKNKKRYLALKENFEEFISGIIAGLSKTDKTIAGLDARKCLFRIYRDARFSHDKRPYKTNFGAELSMGGKRSRFASYYIHIEPGECFAGGGVYMPEPDVLKVIRTEIYHDTDTFKQILKTKKFQNTFGELDDFDMLKTAPKGFSPDFKDINLLKYKHYIVGTAISDTEITSPGLQKKIIKTFETMYPFNRFLNSAIMTLEKTGQE